MNLLALCINLIADLLIGFGLRLTLSIDDARKAALRRVGSWQRARGSLRLLLRRWLLRTGALPAATFRRSRGHRPYNRTPDHVELAVVRLHVEQLQLGNGQLRLLAARVLGVLLARETVRRILRRRRGEVVAMDQLRKEQPRRISITKPLRLWGIDLTLVRLLGFFPIWLLGVVDYHGSRLVTLQRCLPTTAAVTSVLERLFAEHGVPHRLLSDNGPQFTSLDFELFLATNSVDHTRIRPAHPWTNGRVERVFRTFKETVFDCIWLFASVGQIDRYCADFMQFYNRDRPHSSYEGRTPNEVFFGHKRKAPAKARVTYFDGQLNWYRLG